MKNNDHYFNIIEPSTNLRNSVIHAIKMEETKKAVYNIVFNSIISLVSISVAVVYMINIIKDAYKSGLSEYLSLIFSDGTSLISYWQTYVLSVVESLPIIQITVVVASMGILVWSLNTIMEKLPNTKLSSYNA